MDDLIDIVTSLYLPEGVSELPPAIIPAFEAHDSNLLVGVIHVLTEGNCDLLTKLLVDRGIGGKTQVVGVDQRPTFATLFKQAGISLENGRRVAVMNADVSFLGADDISRCFSAIEALSQTSTRPIFALTRHDRTIDGWKIGLFQQCGLPNMLSADCWILTSAIAFEPPDSYSLGEMNCDLMANYDLISLGFRVFNPCLDVCIQHHEEDIKTNEYYVESSKTTASLARLSRFMENRNCPSYKHFELPWVKTEWLAAGYHPDPYSNRSKKLFVRLPKIPPHNPSIRLIELEQFSQRNSFDLVLLGEEPLDHWFEACKGMFQRSNRIYLFSLGNSFDEFLDSLMNLGYDGRERIFFASSRRFLVEDLGAEYDFIVLSGEAVFAPEHDFSLLKDRKRKCTLITSVFKSDEFLKNFTANSLELVDYQESIDHIFLISSTSIEERSVLIRHLNRCDNVIVVRNQSDPGLYSCWNIAISLATTEYVSNANVDDLRAPGHVLRLAAILDQMRHVSVVCSAIVPFHTPVKDLNEISLLSPWYSDQGGEFGYFELGKLQQEGEQTRLKPHNLPHCMPVWRKSLHIKHGFFDESRYGTFADWAFWLAAAKEGVRGYLLPDPLSFYYVNPDSHNRRGEMLDVFHRRIEEENLPLFSAYQSRLRVSRRLAAAPARAGSGVRPLIRKFDLGFKDLEYGHHRNSFGSLVESLRPMHLGGGGVRFLPFIERYFVWGCSGHEAMSNDPRPIEKPWVGIIHVPFDSPEWFAGIQRPEAIFETELWKESLPCCRGLVCLSQDLEADLNVYYPHLATLALKHPTDLKAPQFDFRKYVKKPRLVQAGDWLRQLQAIYRIKAPGHKKLMLRKRSSIKSLEREIEEIGKFTNKSVSVKDFVSNDEYDEILSSSVVLCLLYATAANNLVLECIARHTPIIINPLPSVVEYLGEEYPLYASTIEMADFLLSDKRRILEASDYLRERVVAVDLSYRGFREGMAASDFYENL